MGARHVRQLRGVTGRWLDAVQLSDRRPSLAWSPRRRCRAERRRTGRLRVAGRQRGHALGGPSWTLPSCHEVERLDGARSFNECVDRLRECARNDATFLEVLKADIRRYLARRMIPESEMSSSDLDILRTYILEELAVYWIQASERLTVHVYPGTPLKCLAQIRSFSCIAPALQRRRFAAKAPSTDGIDVKPDADPESSAIHCCPSVAVPGACPGCGQGGRNAPGAGSRPRRR